MKHRPAVRGRAALAGLRGQLAIAASQWRTEYERGARPLPARRWRDVVAFLGTLPSSVPALATTPVTTKTRGRGAAQTIRRSHQRRQP